MVVRRNSASSCEAEKPNELLPSHSVLHLKPQSLFTFEKHAILFFVMIMTVVFNNNVLGERENSMKRLGYLALAASLTAVLSLQALSQSQKPPDPCAQFKTAPKGESAADKKKRQTDLKECTAKQKAEKTSKQPTPGKK